MFDRCFYLKRISYEECKKTIYLKEAVNTIMASNTEVSDIVSKLEQREIKANIKLFIIFSRLQLSAHRRDEFTDVSLILSGIMIKCIMPLNGI